jgi:hypothetical protein
MSENVGTRCTHILFHGRGGCDVEVDNNDSEDDHSYSDGNKCREICGNEAYSSEQNYTIPAKYNIHKSKDRKTFYDNCRKKQRGKRLHVLQ